MKKIILQRPKENFNKNCSYKILIGKQKLTELKNGEEKIIEIPVEFESKSLNSKILWCKSNQIKIQDIGKDSKIIVSGNKFLNKTMPLFGTIFPLIGLLVFSFNIISKNIGFTIFILFLFLFIGTISIWRNKWLRIKIE